jgi:hypothetical protein
MSKPKSKPKRYSVKAFRAPFRKATERGAEDEMEGSVKIIKMDGEFDVAYRELPPSHLDETPLKSQLGEGEPAEQVPHLCDAIQTIGHALRSGIFAYRRGKKPVSIRRLTLKHLEPNSTQEGIDRDTWYRAIYQGIIALARSPQHFLRSDDPHVSGKNPWRLPKSVAERIRNGRHWHTPLSMRQYNRPLAQYRTWEEAATPRIASWDATARPTKAQWKAELAFRKRIARRNWAEDQKYLLPCAWEEGRRLAAEDEKQRQEQSKRQAEKPAWISQELCVKNGVYVIEARNFSLGIFDGEGAFHGARYKYDPRPYLFAERHWDQGAPSGTVKPVRMIELLPDKLIKHLEKYLEDRSISGKPVLTYLVKLGKKLAGNSSSISSQKT